MLPKPEPHEALALSAMSRGEADGGLQQIALAWILKISSVHELTYVPGDAQHTAFNEGRRFVGLALMRAMDLDAVTLPPLSKREFE